MTTAKVIVIYASSYHATRIMTTAKVMVIYAGSYMQQGS